MELSYLFLGLATSLNLGIFLTAMLISSAGTTALLLGVGAGVIVSAAVVGMGFHWLWYGFFGAATIMTTAALAARFLPKPHLSKTDGLTYWTRHKPLWRPQARVMQ